MATQAGMKNRLAAAKAAGNTKRAAKIRANIQASKAALAPAAPRKASPSRANPTVRANGGQAPQKVAAKGKNLPKIKGIRKRISAAEAAGDQGQANQLRQRLVRKLSKKIRNPKSAISADQAAAMDIANTQSTIQNPNQYNPFGSQEITYDENGRPIVTQSLSPEQQGILNSQQQLSQFGSDAAYGTLQGFGNPFDPQLEQRKDFGDMRSRIEDDVFSRLTKNFDTDYNNARQSKEQELYNKGIPFSADPNSRYQQELKFLDQRFDDLKTDARQRAAEIGGDEFSRQFGAQEQLRANQFNEQAGALNQNLGQAQALQGFGSGLILPQFQGFQAPQYSYGAPSDQYFGFQGLGLQKQQLAQSAAAQAAANSIAQQQLGLQQQQLNQNQNQTQEDAAFYNG